MEREARRKKIKSRETDRMALITGRIQALDPNIAKSSSFSDNLTDHLPKHSRSSSEPAPPQNDVGLFPHRPHGGDDDDDDGDEDDDVAEMVARQSNDEDFSEQIAGNMSQKGAAAASSSSSSPPPFCHSRASSSSSSSALVATSTSSASRDAKLPKKPLEYHLSSITPRDINLGIISSESTRVVCSLVIAVLVVLSHIGLPHRVVKAKSLIAYRPLYAVLLSDLLIVATTLALLSQGKESEKEVKLGEDVNWDGAVKLLEWGLILHQTVRAIFIECSLYLAIVVCGLSLMQ